jgi:hypothetical protein
VIGAWVVQQRQSQAAGVFEFMIRPRPELGPAMLLEEPSVGALALRGRLPRNCLGAVFAKFKRRRVLWVGPCAAWAVESLRLVGLE